MKKQTSKILKFFTLTISLTFMPSLWSEEIDPFESIEYLKLKNGLGVYLAPSEETNLTSIRVEVDVGWEAEKKGSWGVSHLLEHVLFRDKGLQDEMTYLQLIKEAGGSANGSTQRRLTSYFGTIPSEKGLWLMDNFAKMLLVEKIDPEYVKKEKATVELEIGRPGPVTQILGRHPKEIFMPAYLKQQGFWKKEFGLDFENRFTETEEQFSNRNLTAQQVWEHYKNFYHPTNMRVYVAGKFNREEMLKLIEDSFGKMVATGGLSLLPEKKAKLNGRPYIIESLGQEISGVSLGTKAADLTIQESDVLSSYSSYLAHTLMKEVRNKKGQTYTARTEEYIYGTYGYTGVSFQTPKENLSENVKIAKEIITRQAINGQMKKEEVEEAKKLFLSTYTLNGREVGQLMDNAITYRSIQENYGHFRSPYKALKETTTEEYNAILKKYYTPENQYQVINRAPYFFAYDYIIFCGLIAIATFALLRKGLTKSFKHDKVRWVRKITYPPLKMLEGMALVAGLIAFIHACFVVDMFWHAVPGLEASLFTKIYLSGALSVSLLIFSLLLPLCALPKKMMVVEDQLLIKSVTYYSKRIPLEEIVSLEKTKILFYPFPLTKWIKKVGPRMHYYSFKFWKPALQINLKSGKCYVFSVESAEDVMNELNQFINQKNEDVLEMVA